MSDGSTIEWLSWPGYRPATWNPVRGCSTVSEGCRRCYARAMAARFSKPGQWGHGIAEMRGGEPRWAGVVELDEAKLGLPLKWRSPRCIFVNSTSDLFHERLPDDAIDRVFAVMALCPQHRFIVLTKRAERMCGYFCDQRGDFSDTERRIEIASDAIGGSIPVGALPLPNVVLGVSIEDQATADERIPHLIATPAACRMVSAEPLLGAWYPESTPGSVDGYNCLYGDRHINWVVTGGESGPGARPAHPEWFMSIRDQCSAAGVAYFHKQNGCWESVYDRDKDDPDWRCCNTVMRDNPGRWMNLAGGHGFHGDRVLRIVKASKKASGRLLDGREHNEFPE